MRTDLPAPATPAPRNANNSVHNMSPAQRATAVSGTSSSSMTVRYVEKSPVLVRGPATGRQYEFSGAHPTQNVDSRDAEALLRTRFFRRAAQ
jgi:hypothetical protein